MKKYNTIFVTGTFDILHIGHINLLRRAKELGYFLIVGLNSDELIKHKKLAYNYKQREEMLKSIKYVDKVIEIKNQSDKFEIIKNCHIDLFVCGNDYLGYEDIKDIEKLTEVQFLERTPNVSTTRAKTFLKDEFKTLVVDIDDTISITHNRDFENAEPIQKVIDKVNQFYDLGWNIVLFTARGMKSSNNNWLKAEIKYREITENWLKKYNVKYNKLKFGKYNATYYIDDKNLNINEFLELEV